MRAGRTAVAPLSSQPFRRYLLGQVPSLTGTWAQVVALSWRVVSLDRKALGWVIALQFLPSLVLGPWFGVVADRHDRRRLLMLAECVLGLVAAVAMVLACGSAAGAPIASSIAGVLGPRAPFVAGTAAAIAALAIAAAGTGTLPRPGTRDPFGIGLAVAASAPPRGSDAAS